MAVHFWHSCVVASALMVDQVYNELNNAMTLQEFVDQVEWEGKTPDFLEGAMAVFALNEVAVRLLHALV